MRPVRGLERPVFQWVLVGLSVVLIAVVAIETIELRRMKARADALHAAEMNGRLERQELEIRLAREQAARETLSIEVGRLRGAHDPSETPSPPTLTLSPRTKASATPPEATVDPPGPFQPIALRLAVPGRVDPRRTYAVSLRGWSGGPPLWMRGGLVPVMVEGRQMIVAHLTGDLLARGAYELALTAQGANGEAAQVASYELAVR